MNRRDFMKGAAGALAMTSVGKGKTEQIPAMKLAFFDGRTCEPMWVWFDGCQCGSGISAMHASPHENTEVEGTACFYIRKANGDYLVRNDAIVREWRWGLIRWHYVSSNRHPV